MPTLEKLRRPVALSRRKFLAAGSTLAAAAASLGQHAGARTDAAGIARSLDLTALSLTELSERTRSGQLSSETLVRAYLERIDVVNPRLNAVVQLRREHAIAEGRAADRVSRSRRGLLHGVPITIKDSLDTAGIVTTGGTKGRAAFIPEHDASVVARLRAAGAIILGKTNTPDLTLSYETDNLIYGRTNNPYDVLRTSGGSSGGAASIISAGGSPLDIGSDTGGSIRVPAHFCGVVGIKPTAGRVPRTGHIIDYTGAAQSLTHIGPLARCVDDLALALAVILGPDNVDPHVVPAPLADHRRLQLRGLRLAHFTNLGALRPTAETATAMDAALRVLARAGCSLTAVEIPGADEIYAMYTGLFWSDGGASVGRTLAHWGTAESPLFDRIKAAKTESAGEISARFERWDQWRSRMLRLFAEFDLMVCPVYVGPAPPHGHFVRASAAYTQIFNLTGWPSTAVRAGTSPERLPIAVQCAARPWREDMSLAAARHIETTLGPWPAMQPL